MKYLKVHWIHNCDSDPEIIYSEIDGYRNEIRKIEIFRNGNAGYASNNAEVADTKLSLCPLPELDEIGSDPQFIPFEISQSEFNAVWNAVTNCQDI